VPLSAVVTAGQAHESKSFERVMESVKRPRGVDWPAKVAGDKGYSYPPIATWLANREIVSVIPQRSDQIKRNGKAPLDKRAYRKRSVIERCVNWLKENRHFSTRYDKLAVNLRGFVTLAFIRRYLRLLHPSDTPEPGRCRRARWACPRRWWGGGGPGRGRGSSSRGWCSAAAAGTATRG
jgi:transposase